MESDDNAKDFPVLEANSLGISSEDDNEYFIAVEALVFASNETVISYLKEESIVEEDCSLFLHEIYHDVFTFGIENQDQEIVPFLQDGGVLCSLGFDDYSSEEQQSPTSQFVDQRIKHHVFDIYKSYSELDMQDFQEHTVDPYPFFSNEEYYEEILRPWPAEDNEK